MIFLTGSTERHLRRLNPAQPIMIHAQVVEPFVALQAQAAKQGFDLQICSGFRSFERQLHIWNGKLSGLRPVVDKAGNPIVLEALSPWDQIQAVLRWSALPGASRHHWGTDFDVYDAAAMVDGYQIRLVPEECQGTGIFAPMHDWLNGALVNTQKDFYRPYGTDKGGVAPERWHLSYAPIADIYAREHSADVIAERLAGSELLLLDVVLENLDEIVRRFVQV